MTALRNISPCRFVEVGTRFGDVYYRYHQGDEHKHLWNVGQLLHGTIPQKYANVGGTRNIHKLETRNVSENLKGGDHVAYLRVDRGIIQNWIQPM
jgi:hypothetical protein